MAKEAKKTRKTRKPKGESRPATENIQAITHLERQALHQRSKAERISDQIARTSGSMKFVWFHFVWFGFWISANLNLIPGVSAFDPFPFSLLTMIVSLEAIFLATFVLISQNRASQQADKRAHLDLQVNLLAEQEMTKILELLRALCEHSGLKDTAQDSDMKQMIARTDVHEIAEELESKLPNHN